MLKKYNQYIKESSNYRYPYFRIMILINSVDDYYKVLKFVEDNFNIEINQTRNNEYFRNPDINLNHILLSVPVLYLIIRKEKDKINDVEILRFYSTEISNINELLKIINDNVGSYYFNEKDILSIDDLNVVISLLKSGKKDTYNYLYNKEKINVYESLLDKLEGSNESINIRSDYRYPYQRVILIVKSKEDYEKLIGVIKKLFGITVRYSERIIASLKIHLALYVAELYEFIYNGNTEVSHDELFTFFTHYYYDVDELLDKIDEKMENESRWVDYYKRSDVLYPDYYEKLDKLISGKIGFNTIYNKQNKKSYESLNIKNNNDHDKEI